MTTSFSLWMLDFLYLFIFNPENEIWLWKEPKGIYSDLHTHPCQWAVYWHCWWRTDKMRQYHHYQQLGYDLSFLNLGRPALKTLWGKRPFSQRWQKSFLFDFALSRWDLWHWPSWSSYLRSWHGRELARLGWGPGSYICRPPHTECCMGQNAHSRLEAKTDGKPES